MTSNPFNRHFQFLLNSESNHSKLDMEFLEDINKIVRFILDKEYNSFLKQHHPLLEIFPDQRIELKESNALLKEFDKNFNIKHLFLKYGQLETLLKYKIKSKEQYISSILNHLQEDKAALTIDLNIKNFDVKSVQSGVGDVHQGGKSTAIITFQNDTKIVYKPRPAGIDLAFNKLIDAFNLFQKTIHLKTVKIIDRKKYCWCEYITNDACGSLAELENYYTKSGILVAFMYFLRGTDIHFENIIAHADNPVLIDIECLFHNSDISFFNILNTGMVPILTLNGYKNEAIDVSGMGATGDIKTDRMVWKWTNLDNDALNLEKDYGYLKANGNQPIYDNKIITPENYLNKILLGFDLVSNWILSIQGHLDDDKKNPFLQFNNQSFRVIPRLTQVYYDILHNSFTPDSLNNKLNRKEIILNNLLDFSLKLPFINPSQKNRVINSELRAIKKLDIPYFTANTSKLYIKESGHIVLKNYFKSCPYDAILKKIKTYDKNEANQQKKLLESALIARYNLKLLTAILPKSKSTNNVENSVLKEVKAIAENIYNQVSINNSEITWFCFAEEENGSVAFNTIQNSLYAGKIGVAIFLSMVSKHLKIKKYDKVVNTILNTEIENIAKTKNSIDISFSTGVTGLIHALLIIDPVKYMESAIDLSEFITYSNIDEDKDFDIMRGTAGCLNVMCHLYSISKSLKVYRKCLLFGNHLINSRIKDRNSLKKCWNSISGNPLTGFSHGASGIGLSLLRLYEISGIKKYKDAFYEAIKFENFYYNVSEKNWQDLRYSDEKYHNSWCHGASGIGLARIAAYRILKDDILLKDISNAIGATKDMKLLNSDHYCCGNIGRIDFLLEASELLDDKHLKYLCSNYIKSIIAKKNKVGYYQTYQNPNLSIENPSLFRGTSGIGYTLLKFQLKNKLYSLGV